jgi:hypothetical protein
MAGHEQLATYLNDHLAGSEAGRDLAEKIAADNEGTELGSFMAGVVAAIEEDRETLVDVMGRAGVERAFAKQAAGRVAEKFGRARLHQRVTGDPGLSRLMELEALIMGVTGKLALWRTLREVARDDDSLAGVDFDVLIARAQEQISGVEERHRTVATEAF